MNLLSHTKNTGNRVGSSLHVPRLTLKRLLRSPFLVRRYGSVPKLRNFLAAEYAFAKHEVEVRSLPYLFRVDPTNKCTLGCPYCWRSVSKRMEPATLSLETFVRGFAPFEDNCLLVSFQMFGEPTLNESLPEMIGHAHTRGAATYVSTNLQSVDEEYMLRLLTSGLDLLTIAVDAATPETYRIMKPGGDYARLMDNIDLLFALKRTITHAPSVGFQVLVTRHNENELPRIKGLARMVGADYLDFKPVVFLPDSSWTPMSPRFRMSRYLRRRANCSLPWTNITLLANGRFFPCCAFPDDFDLGPIGGDIQEEIWNGQSIRGIREGFRTGNLHTLCQRCPLAYMPRF